MGPEFEAFVDDFLVGIKKKKIGERWRNGRRSDTLLVGKQGDLILTYVHP